VQKTDVEEMEVKRKGQRRPVNTIKPTSSKPGLKLGSTKLM